MLYVAQGVDNRDYDSFGLVVVDARVPQIRPQFLIMRERWLNLHFFPARDLRRRGAGCLCRRPILFDQREDRIDVRGRQRGHGRRGVRRG